MAHMRWGMSAANAEMPVPDITAGFAMTESPEKFRTHGGRRFNCQMRAKAIAMANWVREKVGLPLIETPPHGHHRHAHIHGKPAFIKPVHSSSESDVATSGTVTTPSGHRVTYHQGNWSHDHPRPHHWRPASFSGRLNKALMTLGPWEGRIVAFVLGKPLWYMLKSHVYLIDTTGRLRYGLAFEDVLCSDRPHLSFLPSPRGDS